MSAKIKVSGKSEALSKLANQLVVSGIPAEAVDIYQGRNRVVKLDVTGLGLVNIKEFRIPHAVNRLVYGTLRKSKARRAFEYAGRLRKLGFGSPEPLAYVALRNGVLLGKSYFVSRQLEGYTDLREIHALPYKAELLDQLAAMMAQMHRQGVWMKDFSQGNVLWRRDDDGHFDFQLVDINRMAFGVRSMAKLMTNFRTISDHDDDLATLAAAYARHTEADPDQIYRLALAAREQFRKKRELKNRLRGK